MACLIGAYGGASSVDLGPHLSLISKAMVTAMPMIYRFRLDCLIDVHGEASSVDFGPHLQLD